MIATALLVCSGACPTPQEPNTLSEAERAAGWALAFDGETAAGWRRFRGEGFPAGGWQVDGGALRKVAGAGGGDLVSERSYQDFEFAFEWKVAGGANSGIMYRVSEERGNTWETGPEYQILDDTAHRDGRRAKTSAASLYAMIAAEPKTLAPVGQWNSGRILVVGNHVEHWLNGVRVVAFELHDEAWVELVEGSKFKNMPGFGKERRGHIALQDHGDDVWFRNLKIRDLDFDEERAEALFNGRDLTGWTHHLRDGAAPSAVWSVTEEGVMVCRGKPIGYLRTEEDHEDFVLRLEWRFDPVTKKAGNSGVLLRQIGPDKVWPRSIEAQLQSGAAGDFWNIDKFPMQVVEERTRGRNTRRTATNESPIGEWNRYEITAWKGHVVLRVNGEVLNQAWECLRTPGKVCLQSEGAEIHFRRISLTALDA
ncbi:MAG: DUF1080 domain-containing protein [Planctomycetota bacterium]|jgi:hypothetical protein|nr:DUF1080 domain-containing protein [Planctomycetota bacterium]MDP6761924.1 DUF1080 domain-containing protein [Planctomycetota bacterium]MDP6989331.1 DUF1080 domain-containing protein [Planctomycetota bacterium]